MKDKKDAIANSLKEIFKTFPDMCRIKSENGEAKFDLNYRISEKVAEKIGERFYFGTDLRYSNEKEFQKTYKEILKIKRALMKIKEENLKKGGE